MSDGIPEDDPCCICRQAIDWEDEDGTCFWSFTNPVNATFRCEFHDSSAGREGIHGGHLECYRSHGGTRKGE